MPADLPPGLCLAAICKRENPFDAFVSNNYNSIDDLPSQAVVGTASSRRQSQLLAYRSDLRIKTLRGNIHTRLAKLDDGEFDAIILAAAGLERMNLQVRIQSILPTEIMLPSCGQGALCIECRDDDEEVLNIIAALNDVDSALCVHAERRVNAQLGGNCHLPLAVFCRFISAEQVHLSAKIVHPDGSKAIKSNQWGIPSSIEQLTQNCVDELMRAGAAELIKSC